MSEEIDQELENDQQNINESTNKVDKGLLIAIIAILIQEILVEIGLAPIERKVTILDDVTIDVIKNDFNFKAENNRRL